MKSADMKFGNDHIFDMANFDETSRWIEWSKNEFSHSLIAAGNSHRPLSFDRDMKFEHHHSVAGVAARWLCLSSGR